MVVFVTNVGLKDLSVCVSSAAERKCCAALVRCLQHDNGAANAHPLCAAGSRGSVGTPALSFPCQTPCRMDRIALSAAVWVSSDRESSSGARP